ncbi:MAG: BA14K family protein [Phyllobacterium sp.]
MKKFLSAICATTLSLTVGLTSVAPSFAAPVQPVKIEVGSNVEQIRDHRKRPRPPHHAGNYRPRPPHYGGNYRPRPPHYRPGSHNRPGYWNGHRGHSNYRRGYRRHNDGWWYPLAAFAAGAVIGGAITSQPSVAPAPAYGNRHVNWCANKYRSYRAYDNTFQPYNGPRQQCYSPYR